MQKYAAPKPSNKRPKGFRERRPGLTHEHTVEEASGSGSEYEDEERIFLRACDEYRTQHGLRFLDLTDVLMVVKSLGYRKMEIQ